MLPPNATDRSPITGGSSDKMVRPRLTRTAHLFRVSNFEQNRLRLQCSSEFVRKSLSYRVVREQTADIPERQAMQSHSLLLCLCHCDLIARWGWGQRHISKPAFHME
jgi:hypothetical protein